MRGWERSAPEKCEAHGVHSEQVGSDPGIRSRTPRLGTALAEVQHHHLCPAPIPTDKRPHYHPRRRMRKNRPGPQVKAAE